MKQILIRLLALIALAVWLPACGKNPAAVAPEKRAVASVKGRTVPLTIREVPRFLRVTGQLIGRNDAVIAADAVGKVVEAPVERLAARSPALPASHPSRSATRRWLRTGPSRKQISKNS